MPRTAGWREDELWEQALRVGVHCASLLWGEEGCFTEGVDFGGRNESNLRKRKIFFSLSLTVMDSVEFTTLMLVTLVSRPISLLLEKALSG